MCNLSENELIYDISLPLSVDDENEDDDANEAEQACVVDNKEDQTYGQIGSVSAADEGSVKDEEEPYTNGSPISDDIKSHISPMSDIPSPRDSPSQSEAMQTDDQQPLSNSNGKIQEPVDSSNQLSVVVVRTSKATQDTTDASTATATEEPLPVQQMVTVEKCDTHMANGTSPPPSPRTTRSRKRKREEMTSKNPKKTKHIIIHDG